MMKRYMIAALALVGLVSHAWADTNKLTVADGWTKITALPTSQTDLDKYYYVIVDNSQDLMLAIANGVHNKGKWYSLALFYQTSVSPTSSGILSKLWMLQKGNYGNGFYALQNVEYPARLLQTEGEGPWLMETNDVSSPNEWSELAFAYSSSFWTIENKKYNNGSYLGPWEETNINNNIQNGQELAGNKSSNYVGRFQIYQILRTKFNENYLAAASSTNPVDVSFIYVNNPTLDLNIDGWTRSATTLGGNAAANYCTETWHSSTDFKFYQMVSSLPEGAYQVSVQARSQTNSGAVYATVGSMTVSTPVNTTTSSSSMQTEAATMLDRTTGKITTPSISLDAGQTLEMGFIDNVANQWDVFDNFKLYYLGNDLTVYVEARDAVKQAAEAAIAANLVTDACEAAIQQAINTYGGDYTTKNDYVNAQNQIQAALDTYYTDALKSAYAAYKTMRTHVQTLENTETYKYTDPGTAKSTFDSAISSANTVVEAATTAAAINTQTSSIRAAALTFVSSVTAEDGNPFNLTFLASTAASDWQTADGAGNAATAPAWSVPKPDESMADFIECYTQADGGESITGNILYQTLSGMPAGYYTVALYAAASYTPSRGSLVEKCTDGQPNITFGFAGGNTLSLPVVHRTSLTAADQVPVNLSVQLASAGDLAFGIKKTAAGSNWHVAQIYTITYSKDPDLTVLKADRDALVAEANGLLASDDADFLTTAQQNALRTAISTAESANTFEALTEVTLTTLPNAVQTARQQIQTVKDNRVLMLAALERFENDYNLADGTDYSRVTMSAEAWTTLINKVNAVTTALDDVSQASNYGTVKDALITQMDATDASLRLFKSYKAMVEGTTDLGIVGSYGADGNMDDDDNENAAITALNTAFVNYAVSLGNSVDMAAFLGENLDFSAAEGSALNTNENNNICEVAGWEVEYADADTWAVIQTQQNEHQGQLYMRKNWGSAATVLKVVKQRMLPVGKYSLSFSWNSDMKNMTNLSQYRLGESAATIGESTNAAETLTYKFEVTEAPMPFDLVFGFQKTGEGDMPAQIVVDDVVLTYTPTTKATVTFAPEGFATYYNGGFDVTLPAGMKARIVTDKGATEGTLVYETIADGDGEARTVPAGTAVLLQVAPSQEAQVLEVAFAAATAEAVSQTNWLRGSDAETTTAGEGKHYKLTYSNSDDNFGWYWGADSGAAFISPAHKAWLVVPDGGNAKLRFFGLPDASTLGIESIAGSAMEGTGPWYTLSGLRLNVQPTAKGVYIRNGKKVVVK